MYQDNVESFPSNIDSRGNLTWRLSPDDPDQINGALAYSLYQNTTSQTSFCNAASEANPGPQSCGWLRLNQTGYTAVPNRPGWVQLGTQFAVSSGASQCNSEGDDTCAFNMTAWSGSIEGSPSCAINLTYLVGFSQAQCGPPAYPGLDGLTIENVAEFPPTMSFQIRHAQNTPDTLGGNVSYEYQMNVIAGIWANLTIDSTNNESGVIRAWFNTTDWEEGLITISEFRARARDDLTHELSPYSCIVQARIGDTALGPYSCQGTVTSLIPGASTDPAFPIADVTGLSASLGLSKGAVGATLMGFFGLGIIIIGASVAGLGGAIVAGILLIPLMVLLNIIPTWGVVMIFLGFVAILVFRMAGNGGDGE